MWKSFLELFKNIKSRFLVYIGMPQGNFMLLFSRISLLVPSDYGKDGFLGICGETFKICYLMLVIDMISIALSVNFQSLQTKI